MKKIRYIFPLLMVLMMLFSGCNLVTVDESKDAATVIATVNDYRVTKAEFTQIYDYYKYYYGITEEIENNEEYKESLDELKSSILDALVQDGVKIVKARESGCYTFTEEEQAEIDTYVQETLDYYRSSLESVIQEEQPDITEDALATEVESRLADYMETEYQTTEKMIRTSKEDSTAMDKLYLQVTADVAQPSEDEVRAAFDQKASDQQAGYADGSSSYETLQAYGEAIYYIPEGVRMARHILIKMTDEQMDEISTLRDNGDEESANAKRDEYLAGIKDKADAAYQRAASGEDFTALITELGEDPGMETNEYYAVMNPSATYAEEFVNGLFSLAAVGDISEPVPSDFGYHIIQYYGDLAAGPVEYESVHDAVYDEVYTAAKDEYFLSLVGTWQSEMKVKTYPNRIN